MGRGFMTRRVAMLVTAGAAGLAVAGLGPSFAFAVTSQAWETFHHDPMHSGVSSDTVVSASRASTLAVRWSQAVGGGPVFSSPAVAFNSTLGKTLVYGVSVGGIVHAFDTAGSSVWTSASVGAGVVDSPAVDGNSLYIGSDGGLLTALDATTGNVQCSFQLPIFPPETTPGRIESGAVVGHGSSGPVVYFGDIGQMESVNHGHEWALNGFGSTAGNCTLKWVHDLHLAKSKTVGSWSPPALGTDSTGRPLLLFGTSQPEDAVVALDARDGSQVWKFLTFRNFPDADVGAGPTISAPGMNGFADGVVYVNGKDKIEYALNLLTGAELWQFDMAADAGHNTNSVSTAALVGNLVVLAYWDYAYALNATTGAKVWRSAAGKNLSLGSVSVSGAGGDQVVLKGDHAGTVSAYSLSLGSTLKALKLGTKIQLDSSPAVAAGMAFIGATDGNLYAISP